MKAAASFLAVVALLIGLVAIPTADAQTPGTLAGETFSVSPGVFGYDAHGECVDSGTCVQVTGTCDPDGTSSVTYRATGTAVGPYPGTFTVSGTVTFGPQTLPSFTGLVPSPAGPNLSLTEQFTIVSGATTITGTKTLAADVIPFVPGTGLGACSTTSDGGYAYTDAASATYTATVTDPSGSHRETGNTYLNFMRSFTPNCGSAPFCNSGQFAEAFYTATREPPGAATVTLSPADAVNNVGTSHTVTATARDSGAQPVAGVTILFTVTGSVSASGSCTTGTTGQCSYTYDGPSLPGADLIRGCADNDDSGAADPAEPCGSATKAWLLPTSTPGQVTGGGHVPNATGTDEVAFGFNAKSDARGVRGTCTVVDPTTSTNVKCLDTTTLLVLGSHATLFGNATVNGVPTTYRIDADDNAEPGRGADTFRIQTAIGYRAGGTLTRGNVQVH